MMFTTRISKKTFKAFRTGAIANFTGRSLLALALFSVPGTPVALAAEPHGDHQELLTGENLLFGTVQEIRSNQARVKIGETQHRFLPMNVRKDKGLPALTKGDQVVITVNDQNLIVDIHLVGEASHHQIIRGELAQPLITGHDKAVIRTEEGNEEPHFVRPLARSKVASVPVGAKVTFLIDEMNSIADVTYDTQGAVEHAQQLVEKKSPLKASFSRVTGVISTPLNNNRITIHDQAGQEQSYEVRALVQPKLSTLAKGQKVVLFVDDENKVTDMSRYSTENKR
jgi:hypothetical protein